MGKLGLVSGFLLYRDFETGVLSVLVLASNLVPSSWGQLPDLFNVTGSDHVVELMHLGMVLRPVTCSAVLLLLK